MLMDLLEEEVLEWAGGVGGSSPPLIWRRWCLSVWMLATCELDPFSDSIHAKRRGYNTFAIPSWIFSILESQSFRCYFHFLVEDGADICDS